MKMPLPIHTHLSGTAGNEGGNHADAALSSGWWNVHTHRLDGDLRHAVWNCGWKTPDSPVPPYISVGIHPWSLTEENFPEQWQWLLQAVREKRVIAVGEAGLDKAVDVPFDLQWSVFRQVAALADECGLPLVIHAVKAANEIVKLKKEMQPHNPWIIHGFRGKKELAQDYLRHGIYLSFGAYCQVEALRATPEDYLFLETDESVADIRELYARAAKMREVSEDNLREKIEQNVNRLFFRQ